MFYDSASKHYICKNCGLYITKDQLLELKERLRGEGEERKKRKQRHDEYLEWWLSKK